MLVLVVDDNTAYAEALAGKQKSRAEVLAFDCADQSPRQLAEKVAEQVGGDDAVVFINVNMKGADYARQDQAGVEVLKFLRLTERFDKKQNNARDVHCVMYSFQSIEQLLRRESASLIICSDGVTFKQLPYDFAALDVKNLAADRAPVNDLAEYIRGNFTLPDERHSWANWWAARQMYSVLLLEKGKSPSANLKPLANPQFRNAAYLYSRSEQISELLSLDERKRICNKREDLISRLAGQGQYIALIDDAAQKAGPDIEFGWYLVFDKMLKGRILDVIGQIGLQHSSVDEDALCDMLKGFFGDQCACVLLDLRLRKDDPVGRAGGTSGAEVLKVIRRLNPTLPVIMTTASNKVTSFEQLMNLGADAYWIKQGIDERRDAEDTIENYERLLDLLTLVTGPEYSFLRRFGGKVEKLKEEKTNFWWAQEEWADVVGAPARHDRIVRILNDLVMAVRTYLHDHVMGYGYQGADRKRYTIWSIYQHAFKIVEEIHRHDLLPGGGRGGNQTLQDRKDYFARNLKDIRNSASHLAGARKLTDWRHMRQYLAYVLTYVTVGLPDVPGEKSDPFLWLANMRRANEDHETYFREIVPQAEAS